MRRSAEKEGEMSSTIDYETDFYAWTQEQAKLLRASRPNSVDWEHLAEEIEDLGNAGVRTVLSQLRNLLSHMLMVAYSTDEGLIRHWKSEMVGFHADAIDAYAKSMRRLIKPELPKVWRRAPRQAMSHLPEPTPSFPVECPLSLDELLDESLDIEEAITRLRR
jgi:hypothetical protein